MMRRLKVLSLLALLPTMAVAQETKEEARVFPPKTSYEVTRATSEIRVDGVLDEQAWKDALKLDVAWEWNPGDNTPAPVRTDAFITFDDDNLYVGFKAYDPDPSAIRAHFADRDTPFLDDTVGFVIDTFNDRRRAFQFRINPLGVQMEATNSDVEGSEDWSWNIIWDSVGRIVDDGYVVEVAIPVSQLRFPRTSGPQEWGFLVMRDYPRNVRHRLRSTWFERARNCFVCQLETVAGFEGFEPGRNLELAPTVTAIRTDAQSAPGRGLESGDADVEAGLTARWGITPNVTLNAAINPDFSQVEADTAQLNVNERFALFFPEKRPFFLDGADFFRTPLQAVFTRTIADPTFGLKMTGKEGDHVFGLLAAQDSRTNLVLPGFESSGFDSIDDEVNVMFARYRRDIGQTSSIGGLYTGRIGDDYANHVGGFDGYLRPSRSDTIRFQLIGSQTEYPLAVARRNGQPLDSFSGYAGSINYSHSERNWFWFGNYREIDDDFRADSGFITRVGMRAGSGGVERIIWGKDGDWFNQLRVFVAADFTNQLSGAAREWGADLVVSYQGPYQSFAQAGYAPNREFFRGVHYKNSRHFFFGEMRPSGDLGLAFFYSGGETIDFANARGAESVFIEPRVDFNIGRRVQGQVSHAFNTLDVEGGQLFEANLTQGRLLYHINLRTFVRLIGQYREVERNVALYKFPVAPESEGLFSQLLFSYKLNPQTVVLVGYSDNYFGNQSIDLEQTDRTFFVKLGYAWLF